MEADIVSFAAVSALSLLSVIFMIRSKNMMHSAVYMALFFLFSSGILAILGAVFIALLQVLIFTGGMAVLIVMVVMLSEHRDENFVIDELKSMRFIAMIVFFIVVMLFIPSSGQTSIATFSVGTLGTLAVDSYGMALLASVMILFVSIISSVYFLKGERE